MYLYDTNARIQIAREHVAELARDARRAAKVPAPELQQSGSAEHAGPASLLRLRRRRPAPAAAPRP
jgi:hypothetical protein